MSYIVHPIGKINITKDSCWIEVEDSYAKGLKDVEKFSHLIIVWWISMRDDLLSRSQLITTPPFLESIVETGVFACRSPHRPNPIGLTTVKVLNAEGNKIFIERIDALNETPIIDIKPYLPGDSVPVSDIKLPEWFEELRK